MSYLFMGIGIVLALVLLLNWAANASPRSVISSGKWILISITLIVILALLATGRFGLIWFALPLLAPWIMRFLNFRRAIKTMGGPSPGGASTVRARFFEMSLNHETGEMDGRILEGRHSGAYLSQLSLSALVALYNDILPVDQKSADLLEAYLDRVHGPEWRNSQSQDDQNSGTRGASSAGGMSRAEAFAILGLEEGASEEEIRSAHKRMMKTAHPDAGGSDYLAAKLNQAKEVLLG